MHFTRPVWFVMLTVTLAWVIMGVAGAPGRCESTTEPGMVTESPLTVAQKNSLVTASLLADSKQIAAGKDFRLGVELVMQPQWHTYYRESGEAGMPTKIEWQLPPGFKASELIWERPHKFEDAGIKTYGYSNRTLIASVISVPADLKPGQSLTFGAKVKWLACKDACIPGKADVQLTLPTAADAVPDPAMQDRFSAVNFNGSIKEIDGGATGTKGGGKSILDEQLKINGVASSNADIGLFSVFGAAFLGGMILNLMPCVLPVISIKIFSLMQQAGDDSRKVLEHGLSFTAGILASFLALGGLVIAIQGAGQKIGWGFQFQYPIFVFLMACLVTIFSLAMFGMFYIAVTAGQSELDKLASKEGLGGTFFKGVLATLLSTPCSAPFLGTALGFAFTQPWWLILSVFLTIGLGMASPYILLCAQPGWMKYMPKPGTWMEKFKESMGFLLLATVVWLVSVLAKQVGTDAAISAIAFLLILAFACWLVGGFIDLTSGLKRKLIVWSAAAASLGAGYWFFLVPQPVLLSTNPAVAHAVKQGDDSALEGAIVWKPFTVAALDEQIAQNKTVFLDFTAEWCLTCKANEATVIQTKPVIDKIKALNVVTMKADWTAQDPEITRLLQKFGRSGVPLYVIFPAGKATQPIVLPEVINQQLVVDKLQEAGPSK